MQCTVCDPRESICHFECTCCSDNSEEKRNCKSFKDGKCTVCPGKCPWDKHIHSDTYYKQVDEEVTVTLDDVKVKRYDELVERTKEIISNSNELTDDCVKIVMYHQRIEDCERLLQELTGQKLKDIKENYFEQ